MICAGIDAGSRTIKVLVWDADQGRVLAQQVSSPIEPGLGLGPLGEDLYTRLLREAGLEASAVSSLLATGMGRADIRLADTTVTDIICHARAAHHLLPDVRTVIEIGAQDAKVIRLEAGGEVRDFAMNDRCAAGTGRFLEMLALRLGVALEALGELGQRSANPAPFRGTCVLFAEAEISALLAGGATVADLVAGAHAALAARVALLAGRQVAQPVCLTGGVALQAGMRRALEAELGCAIRLAPQPLYTGALGAALLAARRQRHASPP